MRGKLPSPDGRGQTLNLSVHPSTEPGQLQTFYLRQYNTEATDLLAQLAEAYSE